MDYCTVNDLSLLWRTMTAAEQERAGALIPIVSAALRTEAKKVDKDLDAMVEADSDVALVAKQVTVDIVARTLMTSTSGEPMTQFSQAAGGYSVSGTYLSPGGGLFIKKAELTRLGLRPQRWGGLNVYVND